MVAEFLLILTTLICGYLDKMDVFGSLLLFIDIVTIYMHY